jgi:dynein heavy chain
VDEYEAICEKALGSPTSTEQLFALKDEMEKLNEKTLPVMQHDVIQLMKKYIFIADYTQISPIVAKLQTQAVQWCNRMPAVLEEHKAIIAKKTLEFQEALKVSRTRIQNTILFLSGDLILNISNAMFSCSVSQLKRVRFQEELESYTKQVEEFQYFGELDELPKYLKRAQTLDAKLQAASDKADKFNREEEMFEWETTNYPLRKQVSRYDLNN